MKTRLLSARVCFYLFLTLLAIRPAAALAGPLDPGAYTSLGSSPFGTAGTYIVDTGIPSITGPTGQVWTGQVTDGIAVFAFSSILINGSVTVYVEGPRPL